jgi:RimJ/RimL family protein N-acetyltransferase
VKHVDTTTEPITLHPFTVAEAERLLAGEIDATAGWEGGYAFTEEPELLREFVRTVREDGDPAPFGPYLVHRGAEGAAIGGVNLFGPPDEHGAVEFAFGLVPAVRGQGLSVPTVVAALELARSAGATLVRAHAEVENLPARRALEHAGMQRSAEVDGQLVYERRFA